MEGPTYELLVVVRSEDSGHHVFAQGACACARYAGAPASATTIVLRASAESVVGRRYASIPAAGASEIVQGMRGLRRVPPQPPSSTTARSARPVIDCDGQDP